MLTQNFLVGEVTALLSKPLIMSAFYMLFKWTKLRMF